MTTTTTEKPKALPRHTHEGSYYAILSFLSVHTVFLSHVYLYKILVYLLSMLNIGDGDLCHNREKKRRNTSNKNGNF